MIVTTKRPDRPKPPETVGPPPKMAKAVKPEKAYPIAWAVPLIQRSDGRSHVQHLYMVKVIEKNALIAHLICNAEGLALVKRSHNGRRIDSTALLTPAVAEPEVLSDTEKRPDTEEVKP